jgi:membrane-bound lytic murein transglycosylase D
MVSNIKVVVFFILFGLIGCSPSFYGNRPSVFQDTPSAGKITAGENIALNRQPTEDERSQTDDAEIMTDDESNDDDTLIEDLDIPSGKPAKSQCQAALDEALELCNASQEFWQKGDFENAFQALDQAYALLIKADDNNMAELIQQKDDIRFLVSKRILEIYASRNRVVNGDHNAIPLTINNDVQKEIDLFTKGHDRNFFLESYRRSGKYRPFIVEKLKAAGLPVELSWLPLIESGFKTKALSSARALGLWQFIPSTGYKFGLERNVYIDERLDPEKSTEAAIKYLTALHQIFGDWSTVLAAYNSGENRVLRTIRTQGINYLDDFWDLYKQLPWETARYVPRFLATLHIVSNPEKYGLNDIKLDPPVTYEKVAVSKQVHLKKIAEVIGVASDTLVELNPELKHQILPGDRYELKIPAGKKDVLLAAIDKLPVSSPPGNTFVYHRVRRGESLSTIAQRYHTSISNVARANNIYRQNFIKAGRLLKIPLTRDWATTQPSVTSGTCSEHTVRRGESLWIIARRYGTTVNNILSLNNLSSTTLSVGQVLKISSSGGEHQTYQVRPGDNPSIIAKNHGMQLSQFLQLNNLTKYSTIYPGQSVYVE